MWYPGGKKIKPLDICKFTIRLYCTYAYDRKDKKPILDYKNITLDVGDYAIVHKVEKYPRKNRTSFIFFVDDDDKRYLFKVRNRLLIQPVYN